MAILFVIIGHGLEYLHPHFNLRLISFFILDGVSVFFVLSGFLIGQILIKRISNHGGGFSQLRQFWVRRWFRTLPNYFLMLVVVMTFGWYYWNYQLGEAIPYLVFLQNFAWPHPQMFPEAWSLSIEEWFYILFPLFGFTIFKDETSLKKGFPWLIIGFILFSLLFRWYRFSANDFDTVKYWDLHFRKQVVTRFDSLMMGVLGAYLVSFRPNWWDSYTKSKMLIGALLIFINMLAFHFMKDIFGGISWYHAVPSFLVFATGVFFFLPFLSSLKTSKSKLVPAITLISLISYSMYLIHFTFTKGFVIPLSLRGDLAQRTMELDLLRFALYIGFTFFASLLLYKYFEIPTTKLRDRFDKRE